MIGVAYLFVVSRPNVIKVNPKSLYVYSGFNSLSSDDQNNQTNLEHFPSSEFEKKIECQNKLYFDNFRIFQIFGKSTSR